MSMTMDEAFRVFWPHAERVRTALRQRFGRYRRLDIDGVVHDAFLKVQRTGNAAPTNPLAYFWTAAMNIIRHTLTTAEQTRTTPLPPDAPLWEKVLEDDDDVASVTADEDAHAMLQIRITACLRSMAPRRAQIVTLSSSGLTYHQIADRLSISYRIVLREIVQGHADLRFELADLLPELTGALPSAEHVAEIHDTQVSLLRKIAKQLPHQRKLVKRRQYYSTVREREAARCRQYYLKNRERVLQDVKQYREQHIEESRARQRAYYQKRKAYFRERGRAWRAANPERAREIRRRSEQKAKLKRAQEPKPTDSVPNNKLRGASQNGPERH